MNREVEGDKRYAFDSVHKMNYSSTHESTSIDLESSRKYLQRTNNRQQAVVLE